MTHVNTKLIALAIGLVAAMPLAAQTTTPGNPPASTATTGPAMQQDEGFDWGWLGLLGLAGLAGLRRRDDGRMHATTSRP